MPLRTISPLASFSPPPDPASPSSASTPSLYLSMLQFLPLTLAGLSLHAYEHGCLCIGHRYLDGSFAQDHSHTFICERPR
ncbi:hypothetical protein CCMA1212_006869 [Trichoderma ghanense]|uniref:Uncharacterized protein n=1 Tax=Trichoderma ghanense TaxID=65468 RepID=A0ABY2H0M3_9HYPO